jgi:hypothetical protein
MQTTIAAPVSWVETVSQLGLSPSSNSRLQELMDRNNEGRLTAVERAELERLVEMSECLSLVKAEAWRLLGRKPQ